MSEADLTAIYRAFDSNEPLPGDDERYVDLAAVRGASRPAPRLVQRIQNATGTSSHHLIMGHTKCGKTTELNRTVRMLEQKNYATVFFDVAQFAGGTFEYTTVLLLMAGQLVSQLGKRKPKVNVKGATARQLTDFLYERQITMGGQLAADATGKLDAKAAPGFLARFLGELGLGLELRAGFQRTRAITVQLEADIRGFLDAIHTLVLDAEQKARDAGHKGLVVICDGCDKLVPRATDEGGRNRDLQHALFVDHAPVLRSVPCHVIYTVPISIPENLGDVWEQNPEFVPAIPVTDLPGVSSDHANQGRAALQEVVRRRLEQQGTTIQALFENAQSLDPLIVASGGHVSDLILLVREAVLEAQTDSASTLTRSHLDRSILRRALEYTRLVETRYLPVLAAIDKAKTPQSGSDEYREVLFKRLALEYLYGKEIRVDLHPLVAASDAYQRWSIVQPT